MTPAADPAASMGLLTSVLRDVELDYHRGRPAPRARPGPARAAALVATLVAVGLVLAAALVQRRIDAPAAAAAERALETRVQQRTAALTRLQADVDARRARVGAYEQAVLGRTDAGAVLSQRLDQLELITGSRAVIGPGVIVTVDDAETDPATGVPPDGGRVLDQDLQLVVNGLWQAGAEAIAINGERLTATSAVRTAGVAILVDLRPLVPPYVVVAVGDPARLSQATARGSVAAELRTLAADYGIRWQARPEPDLRLPAAPG